VDPVFIRFGLYVWEWRLEYVSLSERVAIYVALGQGKLLEAAWQALVAGLHPDVVQRRLKGSGSRVDQVLELAHRAKALGALQSQALQLVQRVAAWCAEGWGPLDRATEESSSASSSPSPERTA